MKSNFIKTSIVACSFLFLAGCASIINNKPESFSITSEPSSASVSIKDIKSDKIIVKNETPFSIILEKSNGYFSGKEYEVSIKKDGYKDMNFKIKPAVSGWYVANILFGGVVGMLIVDPATGHMWTLKPQTHENVTTNKRIITIKLISDLSDSQKQQLQKIN